MKRGDEKQFVTVLCAWCGKFLKRKPAKLPGVSHGICRKCKKIEMDKLKGWEMKKVCDNCNQWQSDTGFCQSLDSIEFGRHQLPTWGCDAFEKKVNCDNLMCRECGQEVPSK